MITLKIILAILSVALVYALVIIAKNDCTLANRMVIIHAIHDYQVDGVNNRTEEQVDYKDMEDYDDTLFRLWDWGNTRILPKDKFELIKPYIKK